MKKKYTVKKQKDGDYEVTLHDQTYTFSLKETVLDMNEAMKSFKEIEAQCRLDKAVFQNIKDHHKDVIALFNKLKKVKKAALVNYIELEKIIIRNSEKFATAKRRVDKLKKQLKDIHDAIPKEDKKLTKSEERRIAIMNKK